MTTHSSSHPVAIITGAARGIGLACAKWFLARGYRVALLDIDNAELQQAGAALRESARVLALHCDVASPASVTTAIDRVSSTFGRIDALVANEPVETADDVAANGFHRT